MKYKLRDGMCAIDVCERPNYAKNLCKKHHYKDFLSKNPGYAYKMTAVYREKYPEKRLKYSRTIGSRFSSGKKQARFRGVPWEITIDEHMRIISRSCHWCDGKLNETGSGLDRLDNRIGYNLSNVVASCGKCNWLKGRIECLGLPLNRTIEIMLECIKYKKGL